MQGNKAIFLFIFNVVFSCHTLKAAESPTPYTFEPHSTITAANTSPCTAFSIETIVNNIDQKIIAEYSFYLFILSQGPQAPYELSEQHMMSILENLLLYCDDEQKIEQCADALYKKNKLFQKSVDYFIHKKIEKIKAVTGDALRQAEISTYNKLGREYHRIPLHRYILSRAIKQINYTHDILLEGHTDTIYCFDICSHNNKAITGSKDKTTRIWDLNTRACIAILDGGASFVCFHPNGSLFSRLRYYPSKKTSLTQITQWTLGPANPVITHTLDVPHINPYLMSYKKDKDQNIILQLLHWSNIKTDPDHTQYHSSYYQFYKNGTIRQLFATENIMTIPPVHKKDFDDEYYSAKHPTEEIFSLRVTKKNCHNLYLCQQAIENSQNTEALSNNIYACPPYKLLTDDLQKMIQEQIKKKMSQSDGKNK